MSFYFTAWKTLIFLTGSSIMAVSSFDISFGDTPGEDFFPIQFENFEDKHSFFRKDPSNMVIEKITCPDGTEFDESELRCVFSDEKPRIISKIVPISSDSCNSPNELLSDPDDCSRFINCGANGEIYIQHCADYTLFRKETQSCDYNFKANCCEYKSKNPDRIVQ